MLAEEIRRTGRPPARIWLAAALLAGAAACADLPTGGGAEPVVWVADIDSTSSPLVRAIEVALDRPARIAVEYWSGNGRSRLRQVAPASSANHRFLLGRLRADRLYHFEVLDADRGSPLETAAGGRVVGRFRTDPLPPDLAALRFDAWGSPTRPLTMVQVSYDSDGFMGAVLIDAEGEVVWYHRATYIQGLARRANGNLAFIHSVVNGSVLTELTPAGDVVARLRQGVDIPAYMHHDVIATPRNTLLFLGREDMPWHERVLGGTTIWEWRPETGELEQRWTARRHFTPDVDWGPFSHDGDWLHANSLALGPDGNVLVSFRSTHQVISLTPDFQRIEWRLGGPGSTFRLDGDDLFLAQHTATELAPVAGARRVLLFDNGSDADRDRDRTYSRALELEIDPADGTARTVWQFRPPFEIKASITSSARRLENGNTMVFFGPGTGTAGSTGPVAGYEVSPFGGIVWQFAVGGPATTQPAFVVYRAEPWSDVAGETRVSR